MTTPVFTLNFDIADDLRQNFDARYFTLLDAIDDGDDDAEVRLKEYLGRWREALSVATSKLGHEAAFETNGPESDEINLQNRRIAAKHGIEEDCQEIIAGLYSDAWTEAGQLREIKADL